MFASIVLASLVIGQLGAACALAWSRALSRSGRRSTNGQDLDLAWVTTTLLVPALLLTAQRLGGPDWLLAIAVAVLTLRPLTWLRLLRHFRPVPAPAFPLSFALHVAAVVAFTTALPRPLASTAILLGTSVLELAAAVALGRIALHTRLRARWRFALASISALALAWGLTLAPLTEMLGLPATARDLASLVLLVVAGGNQLAALGPPSWSRPRRRLEAFEARLGTDLGDDPSATLATTAAHLVGAVHAEVTSAPSTPDAVHVAVPIGARTLVVTLDLPPLFDEDVSDPLEAFAECHVASSAAARAAPPVLDEFDEVREIGDLDEPTAPGADPGAAGASGAHRQLEDLLERATTALDADLRQIDQLTSWLVEDLPTSNDGPSASTVDLLRARIRRARQLLDDIASAARPLSDHPARTVALDRLLAAVRGSIEIPPGFSVDVNAPDHAITVVRPDLERVLGELVRNALLHHHRTEGRIRIDATTRPNLLEITVRDDGPGIPSCHHDRVVQPLVALYPAERRPGSGLGLTMVRRVLDHHGGELAIDAAPGGGTTMTVRWPRYQSSRGLSAAK